MQALPVAWRGLETLQQLLGGTGATLGSTLYYRVLEMPLQEWETMKTVKVRARPLLHTSIWASLCTPVETLVAAFFTK